MCLQDSNFLYFFSFDMLVQDAIASDYLPIISSITMVILLIYCRIMFRFVVIISLTHPWRTTVIIVLSNGWKKWRLKGTILPAKWSIRTGSWRRKNIKMWSNFIWLLTIGPSIGRRWWYCHRLWKTIECITNWGAQLPTTICICTYIPGFSWWFSFSPFRPSVLGNKTNFI